jgi:thiol-disulfide isomerase/thioredoxin
VKSVKFAIAVVLSAVWGGDTLATAADAILISFSSSRCGPCRAMEPILAELERALVPVRHVDVEREPELTRRFGIRKTPTFVVVSGSTEVTRLVGTQTADQLRAALAVNPSGPLIPTHAKNQAAATLPPPQTRLAPIVSSANGQSLASAPTAPAPIARPPVVAPRSEAMPSLSTADAIQRAEAATVRLRVHDGQGFGVGTGTIIDVHGEEALVLTCGHLFRDTDGKGEIEVDLFVGGQTRTVPGQVIDYDADARDIALVAIRPGFSVQPVRVIAAGQQVQNGQSAFSFGCDRGADPSRRDTRVTGIDKYNQHLGVSNLEIAGAPIDGRSGGGLFDPNGTLIGVCNAADYKGDIGIYAGPGNIRWQLDRVDLAHLYRNPGGESLAANPAAASVDPIAAAAAIMPASLATAPGATAAAGGSGGIPAAASTNQELILILRNSANPAAQPELITLKNPSPELLQMIQRHKR